MNKTLEYGDFQTPIDLARCICSRLIKLGITPSSLVEPTCGEGNLLVTALKSFPTIKETIALEINPKYVEKAKLSVSSTLVNNNTRILQGDFFSVKWDEYLKSLPEPMLILGNPPWVTNSVLESLNSSNIPEKSNFQAYKGIDAITGRSNFDISEWILLKTLEWIDNRNATLAMLCKTSVARKILLHAWNNGYKLGACNIYRIDSQTYFNTNVDACLLVLETSSTCQFFECAVYSSIKEDKCEASIGHHGNRLIADVYNYKHLKHLEGKDWYKWRSGIKHDCSKVMELVPEEGRYRNGLGELLDIEDKYLFPMYKSSEVAREDTGDPTRWMLVTQKNVKDSTEVISEYAPKTWDYLQNHANFLNNRASRIYAKRPKFSIFGVGDYTFAPWKVAISGFYKKLHFKVVGPYNGRPVVLDDTCYFIPCETQDEAECIASLLNSDVAKDFLSSFIFWDTKRPITVDLLRRIDILALSKDLGKEAIVKRFLDKPSTNRSEQLSLF